VIVSAVLMALPRRRTHNDHDLPELPPLGDDDVDPALDVGSDLDAALDATSSLDDSAADELTIDELDAPEDTATDDADGPDDTGDDADEIDPDDRGGWGISPRGAGYTFGQDISQ